MRDLSANTTTVTGPYPVTAADLPRLEKMLIDWEPVHGSAIAMHAGDLGWAERSGQHEAAAMLRTWRDERENAVAVLIDFGGSHWLAIAPDRWFDRDLGDTLATWIAGAESDVDHIDGPPAPAAWRTSLVRIGFRPAQNRIIQLWKPLDPSDVVDVANVFDTTDPDQIADRVAVQKRAFERSTFTVEKWHLMAQCRVFDPRLDLLVRNESGDATSAATFWFAGTDKCARLEPLGTDPRFRRQGHAQRLLRAGFSRLAQMGASGVTVYGMGDNPAATALYQGAGFIPLGSWHELERPTG